MSMQMSRESEELHEGNTFDGDSTLVISSEATISSSSAPAHDSTDDLFEKIDRYREQDPVIVINLLEEVDEYWGDNTDMTKPVNVKEVGPPSTISLDEPVVATIHT